MRVVRVAGVAGVAGNLSPNQVKVKRYTHREASHGRRGDQDLLLEHGAWMDAMNYRRSQLHDAVIRMTTCADLDTGSVLPNIQGSWFHHTGTHHEP